MNYELWTIMASRVLRIRFQSLQVRPHLACCLVCITQWRYESSAKVWRFSHEGSRVGKQASCDVSSFDSRQLRSQNVWDAMQPLNMRARPLLLGECHVSDSVLQCTHNDRFVWNSTNLVSAPPVSSFLCHEHYVCIISLAYVVYKCLFLLLGA